MAILESTYRNLRFRSILSKESLSQVEDEQPRNRFDLNVIRQPLRRKSVALMQKGFEVCGFYEVPQIKHQHRRDCDRDRDRLNSTSCSSHDQDLSSDASSPMSQGRSNSLTWDSETKLMIDPAIIGKLIFYEKIFFRISGEKSREIVSDKNSPLFSGFRTDWT